MIKKGLKFLSAHLISVIVSLLIISAMPSSIFDGNGKYILWTVLLLVNFGFLYSAGWNMGAKEKIPSPLIPLKASAITFVIPILLIVISIIPVNNWRYYKLLVELEQGQTYTIAISGTQNSSADDISVTANPDYDLDGENYIHPNEIANGDFETTESWDFGSAVISGENKPRGNKCLNFSNETTVTQSFTVSQSRDYYIRGYYKGTGDMTVSISQDDNILATINPQKETVTKNTQIFRVATTGWYIPLSLLFNKLDGTVSVVNILYLMLILPIFATAGYMVGTTGFSILERMARRKLKRIDQKKVNARLEREKIKKQMKNF